MTSFFSQPKSPQFVQVPSAPAAPATATPALAGADIARAQAASYGQAATVLTSGQGDTSAANIGKKMLLGSM